MPERRERRGNLEHVVRDARDVDARRVPRRRPIFAVVEGRGDAEAPPGLAALEEPHRPAREALGRRRAAERRRKLADPQEIPDADLRKVEEPVQNLGPEAEEVASAVRRREGREVRVHAARVLAEHGPLDEARVRRLVARFDGEARTVRETERDRGRRRGRIVEAAASDREDLRGFGVTACVAPRDAAPRTHPTSMGPKSAIHSQCGSSPHRAALGVRQAST
mmetsp:Transcript_19590/g.64489  ORF Transcript_19590/g.64489 Transcript_19590/m.64489 type:complete len:222 (-) Transcript_19590:51-716(-)